MKKSLLVVHPYTDYEPGRFLEDGLRKIGFKLSLFTHGVDFNLVNQNMYDAVLFIESPWRLPDPVLNIHKVRIPRLYWVVHGESRIDFNVHKAREYRANYVLLANSTHLANRYGAPCYPLPMAVNPVYFPGKLPLAYRPYDISFIGNVEPKVFYGERNALLEIIKHNFPQRNLYFKTGLYLERMGQIYGNSKIVFNWNYMNILTARPFEGMAAGALMLTNHAKGIEILGPNRWDYVVYRSPEDLIDKINFYLANLPKAQKVASNGYKRVLTQHTYEHRAQELELILKQFIK